MSSSPNPFVDPVSDTEDHDHRFEVEATLNVGKEASLTLGTDSLIVLGMENLWNAISDYKYTDFLKMRPLRRRVFAAVSYVHQVCFLSPSVQQIAELLTEIVRSVGFHTRHSFLQYTMGRYLWP